MGRINGVGIVEGGCLYRTEVPTGGVYLPHALQLLVPVGGGLTVSVDGVEVSLPEGSAMLIAPDVPRMLHRGVLRVVMLFDPEGPEASLGGTSHGAGTTVLSGAIGERLRTLARDICEVPVLDASSAAAPLHEGRGILETAGLTRTSQLDSRVRAALEHFRRPCGQLDHPRVARLSGVSPDHLSFLFKKQVGISAKRYALWVRTVAAVERLYDGASATEAAEQAEFADVSHFSRACRRLLGHSPSRLPVQHSGLLRRVPDRGPSRRRWPVALAPRPGGAP